MHYRRYDFATKTMATHHVTEDGAVAMRCTGLRDAEGILIFEGDIIEYLYGAQAGLRMVYRYLVEEAKFSTYDSAGRNKFSAPSGPSVRVVGNIYENPEMGFSWQSLSRRLPED